MESFNIIIKYGKLGFESETRLKCAALNAERGNIFKFQNGHVNRKLLSDFYS